MYKLYEANTKNFHRVICEEGDFIEHYADGDDPFGEYERYFIDKFGNRTELFRHEENKIVLQGNWMYLFTSTMSPEDVLEIFKAKATEILNEEFEKLNKRKEDIAKAIVKEI